MLAKAEVVSLRSEELLGSNNGEKKEAGSDGLDGKGEGNVFNFDDAMMGESFVDYIACVNGLRTTPLSVWNMRGDNRIFRNEITYSDGVKIICHIFDNELESSLGKFGMAGFGWIFKTKTLRILKCCVRFNLQSDWVGDRACMVYEIPYLWVRITEKLATAEMLKSDLLKQSNRPPDALLEEIMSKEEVEIVQFLEQELQISECVASGVFSQDMMTGLRPVMRFFLDNTQIRSGLIRLYVELCQKVAQLKKAGSAMDGEQMASIAGYLHNGILAIQPCSELNGAVARHCVDRFLQDFGWRCWDWGVVSEGSAYCLAVESDFSTETNADGSHTMGNKNMTKYFLQNGFVDISTARHAKS